jgi:predicted transcriptional regulator
LWKYCEDSARFIFGELVGDPVADAILAEMRKTSQGMSRTELSAIFSNNRSRSSIDSALTTLASSGLISRIKIPNERGRPVERWVAGFVPTGEVQ